MNSCRGLASRHEETTEVYVSEKLGAEKVSATPMTSSRTRTLYVLFVFRDFAALPMVAQSKTVRLKVSRLLGTGEARSKVVRNVYNFPAVLVLKHFPSSLGRLKSRGKEE